MHFFSGVVAEIFGATIWTPQDVIKQRLQVHTAERKSPWKTVRSIIKADGVLGLWRGLGPGLATYCPFVGIYFMTYEHLKSTALRHYGLTSEEQLPFAVSLLSGASAGGMAAAITCPLDVIKTRVQVQGTVYRSGWHAFTELMRNEGPRALLSGLLPRVMWIAPGCAIAIASCTSRLRRLQHYLVVCLLTRVLEQMNASSRGSGSLPVVYEMCFVHRSTPTNQELVNNATRLDGFRTSRISCCCRRGSQQLLDLMRTVDPVLLSQWIEFGKAIASLHTQDTASK